MIQALLQELELTPITAFLELRAYVTELFSVFFSKLIEGKPSDRDKDLGAS